MSGNHIYTEGSNSDEPIEKKKRNGLRAQIIAAYQSWLSKEDGSLDRLMEVVRKFAYVKVYHLEHEFRDMGSAETADDWAQEVAIKVWMGLDEARTPEKFYSWVHRIAFNEGQRAFNDLLEQKQTMAGLMVPVVDDDGAATGEEEDNPEIYQESGYDGFSSTIGLIGTLKDRIDRNIAKALLTGVPYEDSKTGEWKTRAKTYAEVAEELRLPDANVVAQRVKRMRDRFVMEREQEKAANLERWERATNWKVPPR